MNANFTVGTVLAVAGAAVITTGIARAFAAREAPPPRFPSPAEITLSMSKFYEDPTLRIGTFPGKLICLRDDLDGRAEAVARCERDGHHHALAMESGVIIYVLLFGNQQVRQELHAGELDGREVILHGKYYPDTPAILIDRIAQND